MTGRWRRTHGTGAACWCALATTIVGTLVVLPPAVGQPDATVGGTAGARRDEFVPDATAAFLPWDRAWPGRWVREGDRWRGTIVAMDTKVTTLRPYRLLRADPPSEEDRADFESLASWVGESGCRVEPEGANAVLFRLVPGPRPRGLGTGPGPDAGPAPALVFRYVSGERSGADRNAIRIQRTWFAYYEPVGERTAEGRGAAPQTRATVLLLPGIFGNPEPALDAMVLALRRRGYAVLRMLSHPSRFTERVTLRVNAGDLDDSAQEIAREYDNRTAECAYAAAAAWAFVEEKRPEVRDLPRLAVGTSGGAIVLPTVVALERERYCAAVLIAGSADYWLTSQRSNYQDMIGAVTVVWSGGGPDDELKRRLDGLYLQSARLDSFHTAAALRGKAVLMLHGLADLAVPSALGDVLWERLGRPERWTYPLGHELLFAGLPSELPRLVGWLDGAVVRKDRAEGTP